MGRSSASQLICRSLGLDATDPLPACPSSASPLDLLALRLADALRYRPGQRDVVLLAHELAVRDRSGRDSFITARLVSYGAPTSGDGSADHSAMANTVGQPAGLAVLHVLDGRIRARGVIGATSSEVYRPLLVALAERGISLTESVSTRPGLTSVRL